MFHTIGIISRPRRSDLEASCRPCYAGSRLADSALYDLENAVRLGPICPRDAIASKSPKNRMLLLVLGAMARLLARLALLRLSVSPSFPSTWAALVFSPASSWKKCIRAGRHPEGKIFL